VRTITKYHPIRAVFCYRVYLKDSNKGVFLH
jgi:hypothetical protein